MNPLSRVYVTADISATRDSFIEIRNFFFGKKFLRRRKRKDSLEYPNIFYEINLRFIDRIDLKDVRKEFE